MAIEWLEEDWLDQPIVQVDDGGTIFSGYNEEGKTLQQVAADYGDQSANQDTRTVQVRQVDASGGFGAWQSFTVPYVPPPPLEHLDWRQSWPTAEETPWVDVVDNGTHYSAPNPEGWDLERAATDYGVAPVPGYEPPTPVCENREPHEITIREVSAAAGNGPFSTFTVPVP